MSQPQHHRAQHYRAQHPPLPKHEFLAGRLALDFCNSLSRADSEMWGPAPRDRIASPRDFLAWAKRRGIALDRAPGPAALKALRRLRLALFGLFDAVGDGTAPRPADLAVLNAMLAEARAAERLPPGLARDAIAAVLPRALFARGAVLPAPEGQIAWGELPPLFSKPSGCDRFGCYADRPSSADGPQPGGDPGWAIGWTIDGHPTGA